MANYNMDTETFIEVWTTALENGDDWKAFVKRLKTKFDKKNKDAEKGIKENTILSKQRAALDKMGVKKKDRKPYMITNTTVKVDIDYKSKLAGLDAALKKKKS